MRLDVPSSAFSLPSQVDPRSLSVVHLSLRAMEPPSYLGDPWDALLSFGNRGKGRVREEQRSRRERFSDAEVGVRLYLHEWASPSLSRPRGGISLGVGFALHARWLSLLPRFSGFPERRMSPGLGNQTSCVCPPAPLKHSAAYILKLPRGSDTLLPGALRCAGSLFFSVRLPSG